MGTKRQLVIAAAAVLVAGLAYVFSIVLAIAACEDGGCVIAQAPGPMVLLMGVVAALTATNATRDWSD